MGYRGKLAERQQARQLPRAAPGRDRPPGRGLQRAASRCGSATSSSSPSPRPPRGRRRAPNALQRRKLAEIDRLVEEGRARIGRLSEREFLVAGVALYAGGAASAMGP